MDTTALISVIIPSYNSPDIFLTLQSVLSQDYPRIQLIIVDDASGEFPRETIAEYLQQGNLESVTILENDRNRGTVYTMNRALQHCRGEYIFNLASDDCFYDSSVLSDWVAEFVRTGAQVITGCRAVYDSQLNKCKSMEPTPKQITLIRTLSPEDLFEEVAKVNFIFGCCTARTAECIRQYGFYDERYRLIEDHPMMLKMLRSGEKVHFYDRIVVKYRGGGTSSPTRYNEVYASDVDAVLKYDVLPFTRHPRRMNYYFKQWKREQILLRRYISLMNRYGSNKAAKLCLMAWFAMHHPVKTLLKIPYFLRKLFNYKTF